jgi:hypothetical protein
VVALRSVFFYNTWYFSMKNQKSVSEFSKISCFFLLIKSIGYLNFRHFETLGISLCYCHFAIFNSRFVITIIMISKTTAMAEAIPKLSVV